MRILYYLFLALLIFALAAFAAANWVMVTVKLLPSYDLVIRLPVLLFAVALLGALPASIAHSIGRWTWRRRLTRTERELESSRAVVVEPAVAAPTAFDAMPPQAQPLVVPPGGRMNPIYVAIDTGDIDRAEALARAVAPHVGGLKLGLEFFMAQGPAGVRRMAGAGLPIFLDVKLHDIPNTVAGAMRSLSPLGLAIVNVHAAGGTAMMAAAREAMTPATKVIAVSVLTSLDEADLASIGVPGTAGDQVSRLADLARTAGLDGIVCSGNEVAARHLAWPEGLFVVPGLRPSGEADGDQKRVMTPRAARDAGASVLVIGRPITGAADPAAVAQAIAASLA